MLYVQIAEVCDCVIRIAKRRSHGCTIGANSPLVSAITVIRNNRNHGVIVVLEQIEARDWAAHEKERLGVSAGNATRQL